MKQNWWQPIVIVLNFLAGICFAIAAIAETVKVSSILLAAAAICFLISGILSLRLYLKERKEEEAKKK